MRSLEERLILAEQMQAVRGEEVKQLVQALQAKNRQSNSTIEEISKIKVKLVPCWPALELPHHHQINLPKGAR